MIRDRLDDHDEALDHVEVNLLQAAFRELSPEIRTALWFHLAEGEPIEKVAAVLGASAAKTRELLLSASTALEPLLGEQAVGDQPTALLRRHLRAFRTPEPTPGFFERLQRLWESARAENQSR
jgi:hypothetical protein